MSQAQALFVEAARAVFSNWTTLNLAIDGQWGGANSREKGQAMLEYAIRLFSQSSKVYSDELEDYFDGCFLEDFNTDAEDGSPKQVAELLVAVHQACMAGDMAKVTQLVGQNVSSVAQSARQNESDDDVSGDEDDAMTDVAPPAPREREPPQVDEEGFTTVVRKGRR